MAIRLTSSGVEGLTCPSDDKTKQTSSVTLSSPSVMGIGSFKVTYKDGTESSATYLPSSGMYLLFNDSSEISERYKFKSGGTVIKYGSVAGNTIRIS